MLRRWKSNSRCENRERKIKRTAAEDEIFKVYGWGQQKKLKKHSCSQTVKKYKIKKIGASLNS
jgi:hypothetical protein